MDEPTLANAFEPFFSTKSDGRGTGLGLSIVRTVVERAGGFVRVESARGEGTTVRVYLPRIALGTVRRKGDPHEPDETCVGRVPRHLLAGARRLRRGRHLGAIPGVGIGILGVALAFGLTVVTGMYAFGDLSGGHFNPAITLGLATARRFPAARGAPVLGGAGGRRHRGVADPLPHRPRRRRSSAPRPAASRPTATATTRRAATTSARRFLSELVMSFMFVMVVLGSTPHDGLHGLRAACRSALALTLIHLISIPVTNTSVNPARSTGPALFAGGWAIGQLWLVLAGAARRRRARRRRVSGAGRRPPAPAARRRRPTSQLRDAPRALTERGGRPGKLRFRRGKRAQNVRPSSDEEVAHILPPWVRAISWAMNSPRPRPSWCEAARSPERIEDRRELGAGDAGAWLCTMMSASPPRSNARTVTGEFGVSVQEPVGDQVGDHPGEPVGVPLAVEVAVVLELDLAARMREVHLVDHARRR